MIFSKGLVLTGLARIPMRTLLRSLLDWPRLALRATLTAPLGSNLPIPGPASEGLEAALPRHP